MQKKNSYMLNYVVERGNNLYYRSLGCKAIPMGIKVTIKKRATSSKKDTVLFVSTEANDIGLILESEIKSKE